MAKYIDREKINLYGFYDAGDYSQARRCINSLPIADVIEHSKIDKAIAEISTMSHWQSDDGQDLVMVADVLETIKRNIGE